MDTKELRFQRNKLIEDMKALNGKALSENRDLNTEEKANYDRMNVDQAALKVRYERAENQENLEREMSAPQSRGVVDPLKGSHVSREGADESVTADYKRAFEHYVRTGNTHQFRDLNVGTSADGGYTIPTDVTSTIVLALNRGSVMRKAGANVISTAKNTVIPASSVVNGSWVAEGSAYGGGSTTDPTISAFSANAFKFTCDTKVSNELLDDSNIDINALIMGRFADAILQGTDNAYVAGAGSGSNQPTGLIGGATAFTTASTTTFTSAEVHNWYFSVPAQYRNDPSFAWLMNDVTIGNIAAMASSYGATTSLRVPFLYSQAPGTPDTLFGRPVYSSAAVSSTYTATNKLAVCGAMKYYTIVDRIKQQGLARLNELFALTGQVGFVSAFRTDGQCIIADAFRTLTLHS